MLERATTSASEAPWRSPALVACRCSSVAKTSPSARTGTRLTAAYTANKRLVDGCPATDSPVVTRTESARPGRCRMPRVDYLPVDEGVRSGRGRGAGEVAEHQRPGALAEVGADRLLLRRVLVGTGDHVALAVTQLHAPVAGRAAVDRERALAGDRDRVRVHVRGSSRQLPMTVLRVVAERRLRIGGVWGGVGEAPAALDRLGLGLRLGLREHRCGGQGGSGQRCDRDGGTTVHRWGPFASAGVSGPCFDASVRFSCLRGGEYGQDRPRQGAG